MGGSKKWCGGWRLALIVVAVVMVVALIAISKKSRHKEDAPVQGPVVGPSTVPVAGPGAGPPMEIVKKYNETLHIALQFFEVQKSGKLDNNKITWRGDSALKDGSEAGLDLSKGMYDAGDHMKFGFPMAFTATILSWSILEYGDRMSATNTNLQAHNSLKWITDYLINAHPSDNVLYIQVGDPDVDHKCWERPETMTEKRPLTQINTKTPGTDVAAETAAAMAAASIVFRGINATYSDLLLDHSQKLFTFADTYRGVYSVSIPKIQKYYNSTGYEDELL